MLENYVQAGQDALDDAESSLRSALDSLVRAPDVSGLAAKKALKETRYPNNDETAALYTEESLETLQHAYDDAKVILENYRDGYTQAETDAAEAALLRRWSRCSLHRKRFPNRRQVHLRRNRRNRELCDAGGDTGTNAGPGAGGETETAFGEQGPVMTEPQTE